MTCSIEGCQKKVIALGMCESHYRRQLRHGSPFGGRTGVGERIRFVELVSESSEKEKCITWPFPLNNKGYGQTTFQGRQIGAHRAVCIIAHGNPPTDKHEASHSCGKGHLGCVNPNHLSWKTTKDNHADKIVHGTDNRGEKNALSKLTREDILEIRALRGVVSLPQLSKRFGVSKGHLCSIQKGKEWSWLS